MLMEFVAAIVVFVQALDEFQAGTMDMDVDDSADEGEEADAILPSKVKPRIDGIISQFYPELIGYYWHCVVSSHKHFIWTGPPVAIMPRSEAWASVFGVLTSESKWLDLPTCFIFNLDATALTSTTVSNQVMSMSLLPRLWQSTYLACLCAGHCWRRWQKVFSSWKN